MYGAYSIRRKVWGVKCGAQNTGALNVGAQKFWGAKYEAQIFRGAKYKVSVTITLNDSSVYVLGKILYVDA